MAKFISLSGWIGTYEQYHSAKLAEKSTNTDSNTFAKFKSYLRIIFPSYRELIKRYPKAKKHKILVPYYYVFRIIKSVFGKDKGAKRVVGEISTSDLEKGRNLIQFKKDIGL